MKHLRLPNGFGSIVKLLGKRRKPFMVRKTVSIDAETGLQQMAIIGYYAKYGEALEALTEFNKTGSAENVTEYSFSKVYEMYCYETFEKKKEDIPSRYSYPYSTCKKLHSLNFKNIKLKALIDAMDQQPTITAQRNFKLLMNQLYKFAIKFEITDRNIASGLENPKRERSEKHQPFTDDEMKFLWNNVDDEAARFWLIYCYTGLRATELITIKMQDVHLKEQYMIGGIKNDFSKNRIIPIADCIVPLIKQLQNNTEWLVPNKRNTDHMSFPTLDSKLRRWCEKHNLNHLSHDGRHTCATHLKEAGVDELTIQHILGHAPQSIAGKIYIHMNLKQLLDAVNLLPNYNSVNQQS